jgi:hypothetical protein
MTCLQNLPFTDPEPDELHCHNCQRIVTKEEAQMICIPNGHDVESARP